LRRYAKKQGLELFPISAVTGKGVDELKYAIGKRLQEVRDQGDGAAKEPSEVANG